MSKHTQKLFDHRSSILIFGLGQTGMSVVNYLCDKVQNIYVTDTRDEIVNATNLKGLNNVKAVSAESVPSILAGVGLVVISPGISFEHPLIVQVHEANIPIVGDIEIFACVTDVPIVAITGSNGKSTVATLVAHLINSAGKNALLGGNIGVPALSLLKSRAPDFYVLELSSFQLESIKSLNASAAVVLNISADHMDRYESLDDYASVKSSVYAGDGIMIINTDDPYVSRMKIHGRKCVTFSSKQPSSDQSYGLCIEEDKVNLMRGQDLVIEGANLLVYGLHNYLNCLAALAIMEAIGFSLDDARKGLHDFKGLNHRNEIVLDKNGTQWINDSKGTNVGASASALASINSKVILIAGGEGKGADFTGLGSVIKEKATSVILIGKDAQRIARVVDNSIPIFYAKSMRMAVEIAFGIVKRGESVLLSPACASFDMYSGFEERGEDFRSCVLEVAI